MSEVLVLDGDSQAALSVVRSLGSRGVSVTVGTPTRLSPGGYSRYAVDRYRYPRPERDVDRFLADLRSHLADASYDAVFGVTDATSLVLSRHKADLESTGTTVAVEDWPRFRRANDKRRLFEAVRELPVPSPATYVPETIEAVGALADRIDQPVVIKPYSKTVRDGGRLRQLGVDDRNYVQSPSDLPGRYAALLDRYGVLEPGELLVQAYVPGHTTTTVAVADCGEVVASFQEERLRTYPASGGNSAVLGALREPRMLTHAEHVVDALDWSGPLMVEYMRTPDGEFYVVEVNGRYWGSLPFAVNCGVDVPWLHYQLLSGASLESDGRAEYRTDLRQRRLFFEDLLWLYDELSDGRGAAVVPFLSAFLTTDHTFVSFEDPLPTLATLAEVPLIGLARLRGEPP